MNENDQKNERLKDWWKPVVLIIVILTLFVVMNLYGFGQDIEELQHWIQAQGVWGPVAFFIIYLGAVIATIPGTIFGVIAGGLFGSLVGVILISVSSTVGASICFLIARYFARDTVARWLSKNKTMKRLDELTENQGMMIVGLTRLIPLFPFTLLNYGFGLTKVSFKTYVFWSWLCMLPGTIIVVVGTDALTQGLTQGRVPWELLGVLFVTIFALALIVWYSRRRLNEKRKNQEQHDGNEK
ncbi:MAG: TVP38/TMEM64 family protein [Euryarchaeota archaeon]|nr:TVP38/TMEM64 family protein [Euryarchaeota archaeon]